LKKKPLVSGDMVLDAEEEGWWWGR